MSEVEKLVERLDSILDGTFEDDGGVWMSADAYHRIEKLGEDAASTLQSQARRVEELEGALRKLEGACERVAAKRSKETYLAMLAECGPDLLLEMDDARRAARSVLLLEGEKGS